MPHTHTYLAQYATLTQLIETADRHYLNCVTTGAKRSSRTDDGAKRLAMTDARSACRDDRREAPCDCALPIVN